MDRGDAAGVTQRLPIALTIAGSDSGGGAGIQADLKTFAAFGVYAASVVTALTAQNTRGVRAIHYPPPGIVSAQIEAVLEDFAVTAIKIGMLGGAEIANVVAETLLPLGEDGPNGRMRAFLVYDPVMIASSGDALSGSWLRRGNPPRAASGSSIVSLPISPRRLRCWASRSLEAKRTWRARARRF